MVQLRYKLFFLLLLMMNILDAQQKSDELHRPLFHFTPREHWMNDPNGMIYYNGTYHLFYQYHPYSSVWGPMHWGHATSKDLLKWDHQPIALYPDKNGMIFSGSAVWDKNNTSSLGTSGKGPLVAIFTYHNDSLAKSGSRVFQSQGIAYSNDDGTTWTKYQGNPVLGNPGINDFRDPKVFWHEDSKKWIMALAVFDRVHFYGSNNLKTWEKLSEFGLGFGVKNVLWECPDLFSLEYKGKTIWVLLSNINPGGPNKGSSTQYFVGSFDGKTFQPYDQEIRWADFGPDEYAGVTWSNTGDRRIFTGWMSNWLYAQVVPTEKWRSALTVARELSIKEVGGKFYLSSLPVKELNKYKGSNVPVQQGSISYDGTALIEVSTIAANDFSFRISNNNGEYIVIGFEKNENRFYIDRTQSGKTDFHKEFAQKSVANRISTANTINLKLLLDRTSVELFADDGLNVMSSIFFPSSTFNTIQATGALLAKNVSISCFDLKQ
ncbi:MAG: glycoside hydrolase family 32 protein [Chitinophagia bacterium]|nr:glycoside hydrolase family 32 protein [Chitinophagia bacterium]